MSSNYQPDRYKDRLIMVQSAAKVTADILAAQMAQAADFAVTPEMFRELHKEIFDHMVLLAGTEQPAASNANHSFSSSSGNRNNSQYSPSPSTSSGKIPYATTTVNFGKFKGLTIAEIDAAQADDGNSGRGWLEWASENSNNEFIRTATSKYLAATRGAHGQQSTEQVIEQTFAEDREPF